MSPEVKAMALVDDALKNLEAGEQERILRWAFARYCPHLIADSKGLPKLKESAQGGEDDADGAGQGLDHETLAEFMSAANARTDVERALLVAHWLQERDGHGQLSAQAINKEMKHLGHGVKNITSALTSLINEKPQRVVQLKKSGTTKQARKLYKVTEAGKTSVKRMLTGGEGE
jgi:DNA-binding PadR family transcriptional regulator